MICPSRRTGTNAGTENGADHHFIFTIDLSASFAGQTEDYSSAKLDCRITPNTAHLF